MFSSPLSESIIKRAQDQGKVEIKIHDLRDWSEDNYKSVDDRPYGGGAGMVMKVDVVDRAVESLRKENSKIIVASEPINDYNLWKEIAEDTFFYIRDGELVHFPA